LYPSYFVAGLLREFGYPKSKGFIRRRRVVPVVIVDLALTSMTRDSVCLGALRPLVATRLLMSLFDANAWSRNETADTLMELDPDRATLTGADSKAFWSELAHLEPREPINVRDLDEMPWEALGSAKVATEHRAACAQSLIWGLRHPDEAVKRLNEVTDGLAERGQLYADHGLRLSGAVLGTVDELLANAESIVAEYERTRERLPERVPESLRVALGRF
jgi:hypothetical protein